MASTEYNIEQFIDDLDTLIKASLNSKITTINAEFGAAPTLKTLDSNAYFFQTLDDRVTNYDPFLFYLCDNPTVNDANYGSIVETYNIMILLCFYNDAADILTGKKLLRYNRCLKEIFLTNLKIGQKKIKITSLSVAGLFQLNKTQAAHTTGVEIEVTFGK